jgi:1,4-dihydroxy-2-naphthoate octaprenyltransferase
VLNKRLISNNILNDFKDYLNEIEDKTNCYNKLENIISIWHTGEGFIQSYKKIFLNGLIGIMFPIKWEAFLAFGIIGRK